MASSLYSRPGCQAICSRPRLEVVSTFPSPGVGIHSTLVRFEDVCRVVRHGHSWPRSPLGGHHAPESANTQSDHGCMLERVLSYPELHRQSQSKFSRESCTPR